MIGANSGSRSYPMRLKADTLALYAGATKMSEFYIGEWARTDLHGTTQNDNQTVQCSFTFSDVGSKFMTTIGDRHQNFSWVPNYNASYFSIASNPSSSADITLNNVSSNVFIGFQTNFHDSFNLHLDAYDSLKTNYVMIQNYIP